MAFQLPAVAATTATTASSAATASASASVVAKPIPVTTAPPPPPLTPPPVVAETPPTPTVETAPPVETPPPEVATGTTEPGQTAPAESAAMKGFKKYQEIQGYISKAGEAGGMVTKGLTYKIQQDGEASIDRQFALREEAQEARYGAQERAAIYQLTGMKNANAIASVNAMTSSIGSRENYNRGQPVKP